MLTRARLTIRLANADRPAGIPSCNGQTHPAPSFNPLDLSLNISRVTEAAVKISDFVVTSCASTALLPCKQGRTK